MNEQHTTVWSGRYLNMVQAGRWEYASRGRTGGVGVMALTADDCLLLVEQRRIPVRTTTIELPAGLVGDEDAAESPRVAAQRELIEETGYDAGSWIELASGLSSPGLTDERITLFLARDLKRVAAGGGTREEAIVVHEVPRNDVRSWIATRSAAGTPVDFKVLAGLYLVEPWLE